MAFDEELAERIRALIADQPSVREQKMFGGLAFLIGGNMAIAASGQGGLLVRLAAAEGEKLIAAGTGQPMEMRGQVMTGWLRVAPDAVRTKRQLARWVNLGTEYAASLPPKAPKRRQQR